MGFPGTVDDYSDLPDWDGESQQEGEDLSSLDDTASRMRRASDMVTNETGCSLHGPLIEILTGLCGDLKWLILIGKWAVGLSGSAIVLAITIMLTTISAMRSTIDSNSKIIVVSAAKIEALEKCNDAHKNEVNALRQRIEDVARGK